MSGPVLARSESAGDRPPRENGTAAGDGLGERWRRVSRPKQVALAVLAVALGVNLGLAGLDALMGGGAEGPAGSSLATSDEGVAAWSDLLRRQGVEVEVERRALDEAALDPARTLVVVDPDADSVTPEGVAAVARFVAAGGRLVAVGPGASPYVYAATGADPGWTRGGPTRPAPLGVDPELAGIGALAAAGEGHFRPGPGLTPTVGAGAEVTVLRQGDVLAVADPTLVDNAHLAQADDAALALALTGGRAVTFDERGHGYGTSRGLGALPWSWRAAGLALVACVALGMWSAGQRLGPAERPDRVLPPPRRAYVDSLAAALSRGHRPTPPPDPTRRSP